MEPLPGLGCQAERQRREAGFGGVQAGYNTLLTPHWLLGTEFDFDWGHIDGSTLAARGGGFLPQPTAISVRYFGTARERLGYVMDRSLIYVTAGVAWASGNWSTSGPVAHLPGSIGDDHVGWTVGAGYEYAFAPRWSAKVEYLYSDFGQWLVTENFVGRGVRTVDLKLNTLKLGLNYRLDDAPPAATAYAMPVKAHAAPLSWAGSYIGAHAGYGSGTYSVINSAAIPPDAFSLNPNGFLGGFQGGYNWLVTPALLVGIESDFDFGRLTANGTSAIIGNPTSVQINNFATVRGRIGFVAGRPLLYATGGFAYAPPFHGARQEQTSG